MSGMMKNPALDTEMIGMVPIVIEQSCRGERAYDNYTRQLKERVNLRYDAIHQAGCFNLVYRACCFHGRIPAGCRCEG